MKRLLLLLLVGMSFLAQAQQREVQYSMSKDTLIERRKAILQAIQETEQQLEAIKSDKKATMGQLRALQNKLADRQRLISNINVEMNTIDRDIRSSSHEVQTLRQKLDNLQMRYAQSIRYAYATRSSYDMLAFLFSSRDFNEAMRRMKYLKKFRDFRKYQVEQITATQEQLKRKIGTLNSVKNQKDQLLNIEVQQKQVLQRETEQTNQVVQELRTKENKLLADIEKNKKVTARINKAINDLIEREMAKAAEAARKAAGEPSKTAGTGKSNIKTGTAANTGAPGVAVNDVKSSSKSHSDVELYLTPEDVELASSFEGNRGTMLWPVEKGYIIDHFGTHPHPLAPKVMIENSGVDIQTGEGAKVRCVFAGEVTHVFSVAGSSQIVMVKHGSYRTVYNGLSSVFVHVGDHLSAKQPIGVVAINDEDLPVINFQIWKTGAKSNVKLNPEQWIGHIR